MIRRYWLGKVLLCVPRLFPRCQFSYVLVSFKALPSFREVAVYGISIAFTSNSLSLGVGAYNFRIEDKLKRSVIGIAAAARTTDCIKVYVILCLCVRGDSVITQIIVLVRFSI